MFREVFSANQNITHHDGGLHCLSLIVPAGSTLIKLCLRRLQRLITTCQGRSRHLRLRRREVMRGERNENENGTLAQTASGG